MKVCYVSELEEILTQYQSTPSAVGFNDGYISNNYLSIIGSYQSTTGFEYTATSDGFLIVGGFKDSNDYTFNNYGFQVYTDYNGQSNLNTINQDLLRIEDLLKDYLYGDVSQYNVSIKNVNGVNALSNGKFTNENDYITIYFKIKKSMSYKVNFNILATPYELGVRFGYTNNIPSNGVSYIDRNLWSSINYENSFEFTAQDYTYYYISYNRRFVNNFAITSNYNEGQEYGLYGGLTDINDQTRQQGEQTRETITSTDIPTNEMTIDTSIVDGVSNTDNDNFLTSIINRFQGVISPSATVTTITIPIPKTGKNIVLRSDLLSRHVANTVIGTYITVFWYVVFFIYFFKFAYRVINWIITGEIIEKPSAFMKYLMDQNAIITASMM